ncbi:hypothetical protein ACFWVC_28115 [Streptomyces sp. NPDC058691]|uniref:hypothetical protein n=1 Tax=Streptomyces sp. NPDC058691 TaxID=3346601 RepID=UPI0036522DA8
MAEDSRTGTPSHIQRHSHRAGETLPPDELREHLMAHHGWSQAMMTKGRTDNTPEGDAYVIQWHRNAHVPMARPRQTRPDA